MIPPNLVPFLLTTFAGEYNDWLKWRVQDEKLEFWVDVSDVFHEDTDLEPLAYADLYYLPLARRDVEDALGGVHKSHSLHWPALFVARKRRTLPTDEYLATLPVSLIPLFLQARAL